MQEVNTEGGVGCDIGEGVSKVTTNGELNSDTPQLLPASQEAQLLRLCVEKKVYLVMAPSTYSFCVYICITSIPELNHDVLLLIIRHLDLKDRITVERGTYTMHHWRQKLLNLP